MSEDDVSRIDALAVESGHASRTAFIVDAINRLVDQLEDERIDRAIVDGYTRLPQTAEELRWADASGRRSIADEPW